MEDLGVPPNAEIKANHLSDIFLFKKNPKSELGPFTQEIYQFVSECRKEAHDKASNIQQNIIKKKKGIS